MRALSKYIFLFLFAVASCIPAIAQEADTTAYEADTVAEGVTEASLPSTSTYEAPVDYNTQEPSDDQWKKVTTDKDFYYRDEVEYVKPEPQKDHEPSGLLLAIARFFAFFATTAGHVILFIMLALFIGFIVYRIISGEGKGLFSRDSKKLVEEAPDEISEEDLLTNNWETRLQQAIQQNNQRLIIRYSYMLVLQLLQHRNMISYRQDKTNIEYFRELPEGDSQQAFRLVMRQYEYTWYGNYLPDAGAFDAYMETFKTLKAKLSR